MKTLIIPIGIILLALYSLSCKPGDGNINERVGSNNGSGTPDNNAEVVDKLSILGDPNFIRGLRLSRAGGTPSPGNLSPFSPSSTPLWELAEWGSKYQLSESSKEVGSDGTIAYADAGKLISFKRQGNESVNVRMDLTTSNEYDAPRASGEDWPHLLLQQSFPDKPYIKDIEQLIFNFAGKLTKSENKMNGAEFDKNLHAAQFQLFLTIQNLNTSSAGYGDYLWFGIPLYDVRYEHIPLYASQDIGKDDATGKFIYSIGTDDFMKGKSFHQGQQITIEKDLYPFIIKAVTYAKERGYLKDSFDHDLRISGMNIGWEVPGTFDVGFEIQAFDLSKVVRK
ncbi:hypothetical protein [Sphingobacterium pedocola]|uniref:Uncharacterized protein n=1 Tax=Sphingobacterium pedocola TaxID=2082722 RepID=A0ABR9T9E9_9SPHI|nr:hypothetical protein [Sphingobacterium pedocola]MBE8721979.1 hypothetical protein [Sphingobacterium pedocola]